MIRNGVETRPEMLHKYPWTARNPDGRINIASMLDIQAFFVKEGLSLQEFPGRAARHIELCRRTPTASSGRSCWRTRTASSPGCR